MEEIQGDQMERCKGLKWPGSPIGEALDNNSVYGGDEVAMGMMSSNGRPKWSCGGSYKYEVSWVAWGSNNSRVEW